MAHVGPGERVSEPTLLETLAPLRRHWRSLLAAPLIAGGVALGATYLMAPVFRSTVTFLPPQQEQGGAAAAALSSLGAVGSLAAGAAGLKSPGDQYVALMRSVTVSDRIIDRFGLMQAYDVRYHDRAREELAKRVQISLGKKDGLITVDVDDTDRVRAAAIANDYVGELRKMTDVIAITSAQQRRMFFEKLMKEAKDRLTQAQLALEASGFSPGAIKTEPRAAADTYASLRAQLTAAQVRLEAMRQTMANASPEVQTQEALVQALRGQVDRLERSENNEGKNADYVGRYREFKYQETLFDLLSKQYELARVDESREGGLVQVVDPARPAEHKLRPQRAVIAVTVAVLTLLSWGIVLTLRERWRASARRAQPN